MSCVFLFIIPEYLRTKIILDSSHLDNSYTVFNKVSFKIIIIIIIIIYSSYFNHNNAPAHSKNGGRA